MTPHCEPGFAGSLRTVDPSRVPAAAVAGPPIPVAEPPAGPVVYRVATDAGPVAVTLAALDGRWLVTGIDREGGPQ